ncbi:MAG: hypothetical protein KatS3mg024_2613 [Armatimonadota bacterium]|nr:MAG: hypothetical protein KatS3mg024_2613 [Armatimonadota bacterium]GIV82626.1 MAG: hypothetical protein KatS3mg051_1980 [Anaerolineae bacterium]
MSLLRQVHSIIPGAALAAAVLLSLCSPCPSAPSGSPDAKLQSYTVYYLKRGEGLADVAKKYGVPLGEIIRLNRSRLPDPKNPDRVFVGMAVRVPVPKEKIGKPAAPDKTVPPLPSPAAPAAPRTAAPPAKEAPSPAKEAPSPPAAREKATPSPSVPEKPAVPDAAEKPVAEPAAPEPVPDERIFPEDKTLENISPEARRLAEAAAKTGPSLQGPWVYVLLGALALLVLAGLWMLISFRRALREISGGAAAVRGGARDTGELMLVAARNLGRNSRLFWFKAGDRDVFVSTGAETRILLPEEERRQEESGRQAEEIRPAAARVSSGRRPRKSPPQEPPGPAEGDASSPRQPEN